MTGGLARSCLLVFAGTIAACAPDSPEPSYLERLAAFESSFSYSGPSPQDWDAEPPPDGVEVVTYASEDGELMAWLAVPPMAADDKAPGVVYLHGGFAFNAVDFFDGKPFYDAGFVLLAPSLRGENGNPGRFQLFLGEVEDAAAAVRWLATQPQVDPDRIYVFGHSVGGGIAALLSLRGDVPAVHTGSAGGLYSEGIFDDWRDIVPFDPSRDEERRFRLLLGNQRWMRRPHHAFLGEDDPLVSSLEEAEREAERDATQLTVTTVPGDHYDSLAVAISAYLDLIAGEGR